MADFDETPIDDTSAEDDDTLSGVENNITASIQPEVLIVDLADDGAEIDHLIEVDEEETETFNPIAEISEKLDVLTEEIAELQDKLTRATKEQLKANAIMDRALNEIRNKKVELPGQQTKAIPPDVLRILEALMPVLDSIEAGVESGKMHLDSIPDPLSRKVLRGWLDGQRILKERLLAILERESIRPISTLGSKFDPYLHVAVETVYYPMMPVGTIMEERRRGYETEGRILRFAEVVVSTNQEE